MIREKGKGVEQRRWRDLNGRNIMKGKNKWTTKKNRKKEKKNKKKRT